MTHGEISTEVTDETAEAAKPQGIFPRWLHVFNLGLPALFVLAGIALFIQSFLYGWYNMTALAMVLTSAGWGYTHWLWMHHTKNLNGSR